MTETDWILKTVDEDCVTEIAELFKLPPIIARVMSLRGINSKIDSKDFFHPDINQLHDPFLMADMDKAVERILSVFLDKQTILIFGDYDVDGTTSAAFLTLFFRSINIEAHYYIPSRLNEGYGVSKQGIDYAKYIGADILITCDCGINAYDEVAYANENNIDVIITDHHKAGDSVPEAQAVINPNRRDCSYPFKGLCGAGVVFKLALAICEIGGFDPQFFAGPRLGKKSAIFWTSSVQIFGSRAAMAEWTPQIYTHLKEGIKGYKTSYR